MYAPNTADKLQNQLERNLPYVIPVVRDSLRLDERAEGLYIRTPARPPTPLVTEHLYRKAMTQGYKPLTQEEKDAFGIEGSNPLEKTVRLYGNTSLIMSPAEISLYMADDKPNVVKEVVSAVVHVVIQKIMESSG